MQIRLLIGVGVSFLFLTHSQADPFRSFHVGNSLTLQTIVHLGSELPQLTNAKGLSAELAFHIRCGSQLSVTVANPQDTCLDPMQPYGYFGTALPNYHWNAVTLQPYGDAMPDGRAAADYLINLTRTLPSNATTTFYMFSAWPQGESSDDFATRWTRAYDETVDNFESRWSKQYADVFLQHVRDDQPGVKIGQVPSGEVMYQFDKMARAGQISNYSSADRLYYDPNNGAYDPFHLNATGSYLSRLTLFTTMYRECPIGLPIPSNADLTAADVLQVQQMVWNTVTSNWRATLVLAADATKDGAVDASDFNVFVGNYGAELPNVSNGNFNGDGIVDSLDFNLLLSCYGENTSAPAFGSVVPEPSTGPLILTGLAALSALSRRRAR